MSSSRSACLLLFVLPSLALANDYDRGLKALTDGDNKQAVKLFSKHLKENKGDVYALYNRGLANFALERYSKAIEDFDKVIKNKTTGKEMKALALYNRGLAQGMRKESGAAIKDYSKALEIAPNLVQAQDNRRLEEQQTAGASVAKNERERVSRFPPSTGTIRLENRLDRPAMFMINEITYRLKPFEVRELKESLAGEFSFEVHVEGFGSLQPRATRTLKPNSVYTIFTYLP
jgi:tetratricopeptide (TPR) repeat protein